MYEVIAVGTDGGPTADVAVKAAADLAQALGAQLHIIVAFRQERPGMAQVAGAPMVDSGAETALRAEQARTTGQKALDAWGSGLKAEFHAVMGDPVDAILDTAESIGADLIVVGSKGMRGARRYLGSVPNSVAHGAHCAVLVVKTA
jgi:nucleotide-binding universal stress UspA family protein